MAENSTETLAQEKVSLTENKDDVALPVDAKENGDGSATAVADKTADVEKGDTSEPDVNVVVRGPGAQTYSKLEFFLLFLGLSLALFVACLDQTIVSVTVPKLVTEFQTLSGLSWIFTAYLLTATPFIPSYGKLSDILGRKPVFLFAVTVFEVGSAICGAANNMTTLIIGRAVAGLGGGGIFSLVMIIIADVVPLADRPKYQGILGAVFGLSSVMGPLLGGTFTDHLSWRWCFYINLPLGVFTLFVTVFFLKLPLGSGDIRNKLKNIDYLGTFLLVAGVILLLVPLSLAGTDYEWNSGFVIGMLCACVVSLSLFLLVESRFAADPTVPLRLFRDRYIAAVLACGFFVGMAIISATVYAPIFLQVVNGETAIDAGIGTIPLILSLVVFSLVSGAFMTFTSRYQPLLPLGAILIMVGGYLMSTLNESSSRGAQIAYFIIIGAGFGLEVQTVIVAAQATAKTEDVAIVTANTTFWQQIGSLIGVQIGSSLFTNKLTSGILEFAPNANLLWVQNNPSYIRVAPPELVPPNEVAGVITAYVKALDTVFILAIPFAAALFLVSWGVKMQKLPKGALSQSAAHGI